MNLSIGVNVELTDVLEAYDVESFQWYFSIVEFFNGIFLNIGSFNGTQLIFPYELVGQHVWLFFPPKRVCTDYSDI